MINLGGEDEIAFGQAVYFVGPERQFHFSPSQVNIGMMVLRLGQFADTIGELKRLAEVREFELLFEMVFVDNVPASLDLFRQKSQIVARQRRDAAFAGHTLFLRQIGHAFYNS